VARKRLRDLDGHVDRLEGDLGVAVGVGHLVVDDGHDATRALPASLDGRGQHVDLDAERELPVAGRRAVDDDDVGRDAPPEQHRDEREPAGDVRQVRVPTHAGADEAGLGGHAFAVRDAGGRVERVDREGLLRGVERTHRRPRNGHVARDDHPRLARQRREQAAQLLDTHGPHEPIIPRPVRHVR
jgi:hypothetical protein